MSDGNFVFLNTNLFYIKQMFTFMVKHSFRKRRISSTFFYQFSTIQLTLKVTTGARKFRTAAEILAGQTNRGEFKVWGKMESREIGGSKRP